MHNLSAKIIWLKVNFLPINCIGYSIEKNCLHNKYDVHATVNNIYTTKSKNVQGLLNILLFRFLLHSFLPNERLFLKIQWKNALNSIVCRFSATISHYLYYSMVYWLTCAMNSRNKIFFVFIPLCIRSWFLALLMCLHSLAQVPCFCPQGYVNACDYKSSISIACVNHHFENKLSAAVLFSMIFV